MFVGIGVTLCASLSQAETLSFHVAVNTASLVGSLNGPFSLDFQLNGVGPASNTATLGNFSFTGGAPTGSPSLFGGASGDLGSSVSLSDAINANNEFFEGFSAGTTEIQFDASMTENVNPGTPDAFAMAILDSNLFNIPTTAPDDSLLVEDISAENLSIGSVQTSTSTAPDAGVTVAVTAVPEPGTLGMLLAAGLIAARRATRRKHADLR